MSDSENKEVIRRLLNWKDDGLGVREEMAQLIGHLFSDQEKRMSALEEEQKKIISTLDPFRERTDDIIDAANYMWGGNRIGVGLKDRFDEMQKRLVAIESKLSDLSTEQSGLKTQQSEFKSQQAELMRRQNITVLVSASTSVIVLVSAMIVVITWILFLPGA